MALFLSIAVQPLLYCHDPAPFDTLVSKLQIVTIGSKSLANLTQRQSKHPLLGSRRGR